jgi:MFS family permease
MNAVSDGDMQGLFSKGRARALTLLVIVYTFNFIDRQIVGILAVPIKADLGLSDTQLGLMGGLAFALFYTGLGIPVAMLADRFSRTWIMTGALVIWSAMTAVCGLAHNFWQLFLARLGVGVGEAGGVAPAYSLISDLFPPGQRARALSVYSFGIPIGRLPASCWHRSSGSQCASLSGVPSTASGSAGHHRRCRRSFAP